MAREVSRNWVVERGKWEKDNTNGNKGEWNKKVIREAINWNCIKRIIIFCLTTKRNIKFIIRDQ